MKKFIHRDDVGDFECPEIQVIDGKRVYITPVSYTHLRAHET